MSRPISTKRGLPGPIALAAAAVGVLACLVVAGLGGERAPAEASAKCAAADRPIDRISAKRARGALLCVVRQERSERGRTPGGADSHLSRAAKAHNRAMLRKNCFSHRCPGEPELEARLKAAGYLAGAESWRYAENIGCAPTARAMVEGWLGDGANRSNLLDRAFRDLGGAVAKRTPDGCRGPSDSGLFTLVLARRTG